ncbi:teichuronic acid biosynthesis glycosyltransferase TuaH [Halalkalibacter wakoensis JCM 9140]|uniref:Teichuronic acid biosynthesis glycosyltransferase TuaH n=1 Tax=Halalkalibacter wakoensis JCM 9140 TaxID=1236970 RepID=W4Q2Q4_9BACI|nr:glycosyltransferase [Halalkalibacter wakoensis]GAE26267.1 teichuronic acid biosynthesis glycosyltransferase TuaH [Halalkalibacter wakoensis JCM 9140]
MFKTIHVIVAPSSYLEDPLKYRRHRLAEYLLSQDTAQEIIWISPETHSFFNSNLNILKEIKLNCDILQIKIGDYKSLVRNIEWFQNSLIHFIHEKHEEQVNYYLWYTYPAFSALSQLKIWKSVIYDCSDMWVEAEKTNHFLQNFIKRQLIRRTERRIVSSANYCFASSLTLQNRLLYKRISTTLIENGVDYSKFQVVDKIDINFNKKPTLGFVGGLKPWKIDFDLLVKVFKVKHDWQLVLVGSTYGQMGQAYQKLQKLDNVKIIPTVPYDEIPSMVATFDIGILPYIENNYNEGVFPLKFFEYLAGGLPIVGCGLPSTNNYIEDGVYEHVKSETELFIAACERALNSKSEENKSRRLALAKQADWVKKFEKMWGIVNGSK